MVALVVPNIELGHSRASLGSTLRKEYDGRDRAVAWAEEQRDAQAGIGSSWHAAGAASPSPPIELCRTTGTTASADAQRALIELLTRRRLSSSPPPCSPRMRCEHAGFLQKLSCGQLSAKWRRRWFQLQDDSTLLSFNGTTCVSSLPLANACVRERASNDTFEFEVLTATRLYVLRADSEREMHRWLAAIASRTDAFHENASIDYCQIIIDEATFERNDRADLLVAATFDAKQPQS